LICRDVRLSLLQ